MSTSGHRSTGLAIAGGLLAAAGAFAGYWFAQHRGEHSVASSSGAVTGAERRVLYWYDPMQPSQHFDKPGRSPFMDMQLTPRYADEPLEEETAGVRIDPATVQNLGIRLTRVERGPLGRPLDALGSIGFNQRDIAVVQARSNGFVTRVYARAPGDVVARGAPLVDLLVPDWTGAQTEFIALLNSADQGLIDAARQRLVLLGMPAELIAGVERNRRAQAIVTIHSPLAGVIATLDAREGMSIPSGATIASINGLATVWLEAAIPEARGADVRVGREVGARLTAYPGEVFSGRVIAFLPQANVATHTLRIRIELLNSSGRLRPGMFATVQLQTGDSKPVLYVASEALIRTGARTIAIMAGEGGHFIPTVVEPGPDVGENTVILHGLNEGQRVVASGQFLIDSEANIKGALARLEAESP